MNADHYVTGYDKSTERLMVEHAVPAEDLDEVLRLADVPDTDRAVLGAYPLSTKAVLEIAVKLAQPLSADGYDWFLEPLAD